MYRNRNRLRRIISRYLADKSTREEREFLDAYDNLFKKQAADIEILNEDNREQLERKLERNVLNIIEARDNKKIIPLWAKIAVAASICVLIAIGALFLTNNYRVSQMARLNTRKIEPGSNKAVLILANGAQIYLAQAKSGRIAAQGNVSILKAANGSVTYQTGANNAEASVRMAINTIFTPNGGQYEVTLPDGSKVWLNAASSLSFPVSFANAENREVSLKGEAYFEVAKDKLHPFIVKTSTQQVRVLGTHFNINAYSDEPATITTLLEGSVKVSSHDGNVETTLAPDQQSSFNAGKLNVRNVMAEDAIAWKEGYFRFENEPLDEALRKIGRWYNVTIIYNDDEIKNKTTYGTLSRFSNISDVVQLLELTKAARFEIRGDKIIASKY